MWPPAKKWLVWILPSALVLTGGCYLFIAQNVQASADIIAVPHNSAPATKLTKIPIHMRIAAVELDLSVRKGTYDFRKGQWSINDSGAFFAEGTTTPLIYGHNRANVFEPISHVNKDSRLELTYTTGTRVEYAYSGTRFISPEDTSILTENNPRTIILLTCSGLFSDSRRIVYFKEAK